MIIRTTSHRSRQKLESSYQGIGRHPQYYYMSLTLNDTYGGSYVKLTEQSDIDKALAIKGINKPRNQNEEDYHECWGQDELE